MITKAMLLHANREQAEEIQRLRGLLDFCVQHLECGTVHHEKHEYHRGGDCPVMARLQAAVTTVQPQACTCNRPNIRQVLSNGKGWCITCDGLVPPTPEAP